MSTTFALADVTVTVERDMIAVHPIWSGVDRSDVGGWGLPNTAHGKRLAARLERAIRAGAAFTSTEVRTDVHGQTYVSAGHAVMSKYMNADLKRLGF